MSHHGDMKPPEGLINTIRREDRYLVVGHIDPDPDSTGSVLAMQWLLRALGKEAKIGRAHV